MKRSLIILSAAALTLAACGDDGGDASDASDDVTFEGIWARTSAAGQTTGAVYFELTSAGDDRLLSASVSDDVADRAEVHEVVPADGEMGDMGDMESDDEMGEMGDMESDGEMDEMGDMESDGEMGEMGGMDGAMVMQELTEGLALPAGETITFQPGGYHIMLLDIAEPLDVGDEFDLTLEFEGAGSVTIPVEVAESAP